MKRTNSNSNADDDIMLDYRRKKIDLVHDVNQKRKLIGMLFRENKRLKTALMVAAPLLISVLSINMFLFSKTDPNSKTFDRYYNEFKYRYISVYGLGFSDLNDFQETLEAADNYKVSLEAKMLRAIRAMDQCELDKALSILMGIDSKDARWLEALCYVKSHEDIRAQNALAKIIEEKGLFSPNAQEIMQKHYSKNAGH